MDALSDGHSAQRGDRLRQSPGEHDCPLSLIVPTGSRLLAREQLNVTQCGFAIECLSEVHSTLARQTDRSVGDQVTYQACESQGARACFLVRHAEAQVAGDQFITSLVSADLIERRLEADDEAIPPDVQRAGPHPAAIRTQELMIRRAGQPAPSLQHDRYALALALHHHFSLGSDAEPAVFSGAEEPHAACSGQALDASARAVGEQHRSPTGNAGSAPITHETETNSREIIEHTRLREVIGHDA